MLRNASNLIGSKIHANDGDLGTISDLYFDDKFWTVRYLIVKTGHWLSEREVLISPVAVKNLDWENRTISLDLTMEQVRDSPDIDTDKPVHRQHEEELHLYYQWPPYWVGGYYGGNMYGPAPYPPLFEIEELEKEREKGQTGDPHLRSAQHVTNHHIQAIDGEIGHVEDFIIEEDTWAIRFLETDTRNWWPGKKVLISPRWISHVSWDDEKVSVCLTRDAIRNSPEYDPSKPISPEYASDLQEHYEEKIVRKEETSSYHPL